MSKSETHITSPSSKKRKRDIEPVQEIEVDVTAPEPPSKKALRKAKKAKINPTKTLSTSNAPETATKKTVPTPTSGADSDQNLPKRSEDDDITETPNPKRSGHGTWIGNLPWIVTKDHLIAFFTSNSDIAEAMITRIHMPAPKTNIVEASRQRIKPQNKGFAYVDFADETCVTTAIALSEKLISGRRVLIKNAKSFEGRPDPLKENDGSGDRSAKQSGKQPNKKVFVGNLAFDTTEEELQEQFAKCGEVEKVFIATFQDTGKCKGYAWLEFQELEAAVAAVRGWVSINEKSDEESESSATEVEQERISKVKKLKTRKWWVNRIRGRPLRMEFAEDKVTRYKKRYGKDGTARRDNMASDDPAVIDETTTNVNVDKPELAGFEKLTGQIVKSSGKKIVFE